MVSKRDRRDLFYLRKRKTDRKDTSGEPSQGMGIRTAGLGMTIPFTLLAGPLLGFLVGSWLAGLCETSWVMPTAVILGLAGSIRLTIQMLRQMSS